MKGKTTLPETELYNFSMMTRYDHYNIPIIWTNQDLSQIMNQFKGLFWSIIDIEYDLRKSIDIGWYNGIL